MSPKPYPMHGHVPVVDLGELSEYNQIILRYLERLGQEESESKKR